VSQNNEQTQRFQRDLLSRNAREGMAFWRGKMLWKGLRILVVPAIAPWLGIGARLLSSDPFKLVGVGIVLWIGTAAWVWYWIRPLRGKLPRRDVTTPVLVFTLEFATFYTLSVLVTGAVLHH